MGFQDAKKVTRTRLVGAGAVCFFATLVVWAEKTQRDPDTITREQMVVMARQLGVTCTYCHDTKNFKSAALPTFKIAREHIRITALLNSKQGFGNHIQIECYSCHQGKAKPAYREPLSPAKHSKSHF